MKQEIINDDYYTIAFMFYVIFYLDDPILVGSEISDTPYFDS